MAREIQAQLKYARVSPQKTRRVAQTIRGISVVLAEARLSVLAQRPAPVLRKLLRSASANAKTNGLEAKDLVVKKLVVNEGPVFKRYMPRAHGRAARIRKRTSHITLVLEEK